MNNKALIILIVTLLLIGLFGWLGIIELRSEEPRRAIVSLEMLLSGEYVVPKINGWSYYNKPPLFNWVMALFFVLFGTSEWVVRLPSLLSILAIGIVVYLIGKRFLIKEQALIASLFFITCGEVLLYGSVITGEIDFFYSLIIVVQAITLFYNYSKKNWHLLFSISYLLMALGFLTKGLPSITFQFFTLIAIGLTFKDWKFFFRWQHFTWAIIGFGVIAGYLLIYDQQDDALGFLARQTKEASMRSSLESSLTDIVKGFILFPLNFLKLLLPWSLIILLANKNAINSIKQNALLRFCFWFILCNILIYWFAGSFGHRYIYMFLPFMGIILAGILYDGNQPLKKSFLNLFKGIILLSPALFMGLVYYLPELVEVDSFGIKFSVLMLLFVATIYSVLKFKQIILSTILLMIVVRIGLNFFYLPILQDTGRAMYYRQGCKEIIAITGDSQIFIHGDPYVFNSKTIIGPLKIDKQLSTAPLIPYKIPYYLTRSNKKIMLFDPELKPGRFYVIPENKLGDHEILYEIKDEWQKKIWYLIKT